MVSMFAVCFIAASAQVPEGPDAESLTRSLFETTRSLAEAVMRIEDEPAAKKARQQLDELNTRFVSLEKQLLARPERERLAAELNWAGRLEKQTESLRLAHDRIFTKQKPVYKVAFSNPALSAN